MKRTLQLIAVLSLLVWAASQLQAQRVSRSSGSSKSSHQPSSVNKPSSFDVGGTKYKLGESYKSTGLPKVERSGSAKKEFLNSIGFKKAPAGYEVDHIVPLSKGGVDKPANMQLLPKEVHKQKTASERRRR